jgi:hypothetical protein
VQRAQVVVGGLPHDDAGARTGGLDREPGQYRDAEPARHHLLDGHEVVGLHGDPRRESRGVAELEQVAATAGAPGDPPLLGEARELDPVTGRERMPLRQDDVHAVAAERQHLQASGALAVRVTPVTGIAEGQGEVGAVLAHGGDRLGRLGLDEAHDDPRMPRRHHRHELGHDRGRRRREGGEPHAPRTQSAERRELAVGGIDRRRDRGAVTREHLPRGGEADAAAGALDERHPRACLGAAELLAHRGLAVAERGRGGGDGTVVGDRPHRAQARRIERRSQDGFLGGHGQS